MTDATPTTSRPAAPQPSRAHVDALRSSVERLYGLASPMSEEELTTGAYPSEWTVAQVLSHLGSGAVITQRRLDEHPSSRSKRVLLQGWEQFDEKVDRIVSIGAFEHFGRDRYAEFFAKANAALPAGGVMLLHTIIQPSEEEFAGRGLPITMTKLRFMKFIMEEIFPGGDLPPAKVVEEHAQRAGFDLKRVQQLRLHYARTLDIWAAALEAHRDEAIAVQSQEVYDRYMKYLTGCAELFREGYTDVAQFTLAKV